MKFNQAAKILGKIVAESYRKNYPFVLFLGVLKYMYFKYLQ